MTAMLSKDPYILIEMPDECDCRFVGSWLLKVAEAQSFWSQMSDHPAFKDSASALCLESAALEALSALKQTNSPFHSGKASHVLGVDLEFFGVEFAVMIQLGFFVLADQTFQTTVPESADQTYHMTVPESVTFDQVQRAALNVAATKASGEIVQPERLLRTLPQAEARQLARLL
ncbi:hypothetical protein SAMN05443247_05420 [Bradyrhizobium erythrophlei]|nr:hypothetical protein SAMN05443247_05420 [Bradyrhizobium erythrophlei]